MWTDKFGSVAAFGVLFALTACQGTPEAGRSLVGGGKLPQKSALAEETIVIGTGNAADVINVEIRPNNQVVVSHYRHPALAQPVSQERSTLSFAQGQRVRRMLWRLRPSDAAPSQTAVPIGCPLSWGGLHTGSAAAQWSVAFRQRGQHGKILVFLLPPNRYCKTHAFADAQQVIRQVLQVLPISESVQRFPT